MGMPIYGTDPQGTHVHGKGTQRMVLPGIAMIHNGKNILTDWCTTSMDKMRTQRKSGDKVRATAKSL